MKASKEDKKIYDQLGFKYGTYLAIITVFILILVSFSGGILAGILQFPKESFDLLNSIVLLTIGIANLMFFYFIFKKCLTQLIKRVTVFDGFLIGVYFWIYYIIISVLLQALFGIVFSLILGNISILSGFLSLPIIGFIQIYLTASLIGKYKKKHKQMHSNPSHHMNV